jgi:mono/diheme cytochrome c family protein
MRRSILPLAAVVVSFLATGGALAADGAALYGQHCVACHQAVGAGLPSIAPPLTGAVATRGSSPQGRGYLAQVLVHGLSGRIQADGADYNGVMPAQAQLADPEIATVLNHILNGFKDGPIAVEVSEVAAARALKPSAKELRALREATRAR